MTINVTLTRRWPAVVEGRLAANYRVTLNTADLPLSRYELAAALQTADALCPTVSDRLDAELLNTPDTNVRIIASFGVGFDHIDLDAARERCITVTNTPDVLTDCTADLTMTLLLGVARRTGEGERQVRNRAWTGWHPTYMLGTKVTGKTLGVVGLGRIGHAVARRAHYGFGMKVLYFNPNPPPAATVEAVGAERCESLDALLTEADFVSLHCPSTPETYHLMNTERFAQMQRSAFLINTARGDVVDSHALATALSHGGIAGAGLDVYEGEPSLPEALLDQENVMLLPHLGSATEETRIAMGMRVVDNIDAFFAGHDPPDRLV